jgi:D-glycero-D-manno-heptose 1,7-bisphosphate phosphatase
MKHIILIVGYPAAGKSTIVNNYIQQGYHSISRDVIGGGLDHVDEELLKMVSKGNPEKIILDNTYLTKTSRANAIFFAKKYGYKITCNHIGTSIEDAMVNSVTRMINMHGKLIVDNDEYKTIKIPNIFPIAALYTAKKIFEKPDYKEGFDEIFWIPFRRADRGYTNKALILDYDGTLRKTISGNKYPVNINDIEILPNRITRLQEYKNNGYILLGISNQSGIAKKELTTETAIQCFDKTNELLGFDIDYKFCPHSVPPITCYCRKPGVGFGIEFIEKYKLNANECIMVGDLKTDSTFASRCGFKFVNSDIFFN